MSEMTSGNAAQYSTSEKLAARARLHTQYSVSDEGWFEWVARRLDLREGDKVLDIGCGPGWFWTAAAPVLPERLDLTLADQSAGMVKEALERCQSRKQWSVTGSETDAVNLPFADASFDTVVAMHMLYHVRDQETAIAEMHRVLKPGGLLAVTTNGAGNLRDLYALTTVFGSDPVEPVAAHFGFDIAQTRLRAQFGNVKGEIQPARLRITSAKDVFMALTSFPPGDGAPEDQLTAFRAVIDAAFVRGNGVLDVEKEVGLFLSRKAD
ncbi:MAG: class I SAM-dependent methyltransferase [Devosia sp.]